jgi:recombinational DNA repair protein (RecF pathway)
MAYQTYTTEAIVCGSRDSYTSDRSFLLFTRDAGMLWATARSVREEKSKQRHALQEFAHVRVSLVRGRSGWRIGSAEAIGNYYAAAPSREARGAAAAIVRFLRQYLQGDTPHPALFADATAALAAVASAEEGTTATIGDLFRLRSLYQLGYVAPEPAYKALVDGPFPATNLSSLPPEAQAAITKALAVSHL